MNPNLFFDDTSADSACFEDFFNCCASYTKDKTLNAYNAVSYTHLDVYKRQVLYHAALGVYKKLRKKQQFEVSLYYLREFDFEPVTTIDEYFVKYDVPTAFTVRGKTCLLYTSQYHSADKMCRANFFPFQP